MDCPAPLDTAYPAALVASAAELAGELYAAVLLLPAAAADEVAGVPETPLVGITRPIAMLVYVGVRSSPLFGGPVNCLALQASSRALHFFSQMLQLSPPVGESWSQHVESWSQQFWADWLVR